MKKKASPPAEAGGGSDWLATYCDMVTLLMTFFILMFAISQVDVQKWNIIVAVMSNKGATLEELEEIGSRHNINNKDEFDPNDPHLPLPVGDEPDVLLATAFATIQEEIEKSGATDQISVALGDDYIFIRFVDEMLFNPNSAVIRQQDYQYLDFVGKSLKMIENDIGLIRIDGHTAAILEQENYPVSDRDLSSARSNAVLKYFEDTIGIRGDRLESHSFGKQRPIAPNDTEEGRKQNRRIEILVTKTNEIADQLDNIYEKLLQ